MVNLYSLALGLVSASLVEAGAACSLVSSQAERTDGGVRADEGTLVALDALLGVPLGNHNSGAALLVSGSTLLPLAVDVALEGGDRQAVAVHTGDGLHNVADLLDQSLGSLQGLRSRISSGVGPGGGDLDLMDSVQRRHR